MGKTAKKCAFDNGMGFCVALTVSNCTEEIAENCRFFKTEKQHQAEQNFAILLNRRHGNCENCRYLNRAGKKCELKGADELERL